MEKVLEVDGLTKLYNNGRGVRDISFEVYKGDVFGFLGPNGAGKTTVMKSITGLNTFKSGKVEILGFDIKTQFEKALGKVGAIIETADLYEYMSAYYNLKIASRFYKNMESYSIDEILAIVQLTEFKNEKVSKFSLGMKQRLALALALISKPQLVILDEPTNGLDIEGTVAMRNLIIELAANRGITFFISSHLVHEIELMCNRVAIINNGQLINKGEDIKTIKEKYTSLEDFYMAEVKNVAIYIIINLLVVFIVSMASSIVLNGNSSFSVPHIMFAYIIDILPAVVLALFASFIAQFFKSSSGAIITCILSFIGIKALALFINGLNNMVFTSYLNWYSIWTIGQFNFARTINILFMMLAYGSIFFTMGYYFFDKKEV